MRWAIKGKLSHAYFTHVAGFEIFRANDTWDGLSMIQGVGKMGTQPSVLLRKCSVAYAMGPLGFGTYLAQVAGF